MQKAAQKREERRKRAANLASWKLFQDKEAARKRRATTVCGLRLKTERKTVKSLKRKLAQAEAPLDDAVIAANIVRKQGRLVYKFGEPFFELLVVQ